MLGMGNTSVQEHSKLGSLDPHVFDSAVPRRTSLINLWLIERSSVALHR